MVKHDVSEEFYGVTTIGEKGQACIPAEAREALNLQKGDKLLVFGMGRDVLALTKLSQLEEMAKGLTKRLEGVQKVIRKANGKKS